MASNNPVPINDSSRCKTCGEIISSDCVAWAGGGIQGITVCEGATITDVVRSIGGCCGASPDSPCYTGSWVNFSAGIPLSGSGAGYSWVISNMGFGGTYNTPEYKWTKDGDLSVRGGFNIVINTTIDRLFISIPLVNISSTCFPAAFNRVQSVTVAIDETVSNKSTVVVHGELVMNPAPTGLMTIDFSFADPPATPINFDLDFGGTRFNLA